MAETERSYFSQLYRQLDSHAAQWAAVALILKNAGDDAWEGFTETIKAARNDEARAQQESQATADAISGLVHWGCDHYFAEDTPLLGPALIAPFREHHRDPLAITRRDGFTLNVSNAPAAIPSRFALRSLMKYKTYPASA